MEPYPLVRKTLEGYGVEGTTWTNLLEKTKLTNNQLYQVIGRGFKNGAMEMYSKDGVQLYRNRPKGKRLYPTRDFK